MADSNFEQVIKKDRAARESTRWKGTLLEYLDVVKSRPDHHEAFPRAHLRHDHVGRRAQSFRTPMTRAPSGCTRTSR